LQGQLKVADAVASSIAQVAGTLLGITDEVVEQEMKKLQESTKCSPVAGTGVDAVGSAVRR